MESIVIDLQKEILDEKTNISQLLRKSLVVAIKLNLSDFEEWIRSELNGYTENENISQYRYIKGEIKGWNPYHGWVPFIIEDINEAERLSHKFINQPIGELESLAGEKDSDGVLASPFSEEMKQALMKSSDLALVPTLLVSRVEIIGILDAVRNLLLEWNLRLESDGIVGTGLEFSEQEKQKATEPTYKIENFMGVLGDVSGGSVEISGFSSIRSQLNELGVPKEEQAKLEDIFLESRESTEAKSEGILKRGEEWIQRNIATVGTFSEVIRGWLQFLNK